MTELNFADISDRLKQLILPPTDLVIGVGRGGIVPAAMVAHQLGCEMQVVQVNYRDDENTPRYDLPRILSALTLPHSQSLRLLIVDDVSVSGKTLDVVKQLFSAHSITTLVCKGKADYVLYPEIRECVHWPWKVVAPSAV